jgi:sulfate adenylyltransferase
MKKEIIFPHGGKLINRLILASKKGESLEYAKTLLKIELSEELVMDVDKIAIGAFSPIEGFFSKADFEGVVENMKLANGTSWTLPIILDVSEEIAEKIIIGQKIALIEKGKSVPFAILCVNDKYGFDRRNTVKKIFGTDDDAHPGVKRFLGLNPILIGGKIDLIERPRFEFSDFEMTPNETRIFFKSHKWKSITGFHTRNAVHRAHEYLQRCSLEITDGILIHPVVGRKKKGDFTAGAIIASYQAMLDHYYPKDKVLFSVISTYSRYAGPREAIFTALMRKNYGCTHFIVGRDHTGVGDYYDVYASHKIFDDFYDDLEINPLRFHEPLWCKKCEQISTDKTCIHKNQYKKISGTLIRELLNKGESIPKEMMRPEVVRALLNFSKDNKIFVDSGY